MKRVPIISIRAHPNNIKIIGIIYHILFLTKHYKNTILNQTSECINESMNQWCRLYVISRLKKLEVLDDSPVTNAERELAEKIYGNMSKSVSTEELQKQSMYLLFLITTLTLISLISLISLILSLSLSFLSFLSFSHSHFSHFSHFSHSHSHFSHFSHSLTLISLILSLSFLSFLSFSHSHFSHLLYLICV
jgi:hypothetical protein